LSPVLNSLAPAQQTAILKLFSDIFQTGTNEVGNINNTSK